MALSNWLTRDEWNACYFLGLNKTFEAGARPPDLGELLKLGISELHKAGYKFKGIKSEPSGDYTKVTQCCDGNERVLVELMDGTFNDRARVEEFVIWAPKNIPNVEI